MDLIARAPKGTKDILPGESYKWKIMEDIAERTVAYYGFREIRTPVFEHTNLFERSVGEDTDVVQKEMYTFEDRAGRSLTLRPEGTAGVARAVLENGLHNGTLPLKTYYLSSCYRYEKPQSGRLREFHQFGVEVFGAAAPVADAEIISLANSIFQNMGVDKLSLQINSIGCTECRREYRTALKEYFSAREGELCELCKSRLERNPLRVLDCKEPGCKAIAETAPKILDYLCEGCKQHFEEVQMCLDTAGIEYEVNPGIVRGLDYYTRTVFEFVYTGKETQNTICGGGRYDSLIEELGGPGMPSLGFGLGLERLMDVMKNEDQGFSSMREPTSDLFFATLGSEAALRAFNLTEQLRESSFRAQTDLSSRGLKSQLKYADKIGAKFVVVIGDSELERNRAMLKNMSTGEEHEISLGEDFIDEFFEMFDLLG